MWIYFLAEVRLQQLAKLARFNGFVSRTAGIDGLE